MHMSHRWYPVVAAATLGVVGLSVPAIAEPSSTVATHSVVNIVEDAGQVVFSPTKVMAKATDPSNCTKTIYSFNISNLTKSTQTLLYRGAPAFDSIPPNLHEGICRFGRNVHLGPEGAPEGDLAHRAQVVVTTGTVASGPAKRSAPPGPACLALTVRNQPMLDGDRDCLGTVSGAQLPEDAADVNVHRVPADPELLRDLRVGESLRDQEENFLLTRGQRPHGWWGDGGLGHGRLHPGVCSRNGATTRRPCGKLSRDGQRRVTWRCLATHGASSESEVQPHRALHLDHEVIWQWSDRIADPFYGDGPNLFGLGLGVDLKPRGVGRQ